MSWATGYTPGLRADRHGRHADVSVVALHGHSGVRGVRTRPRFADRRQLRPGRLRLRDAAHGGRAAGVPRHRGRIDLHLLAVAGRLHRGDDRRRQDPDARQHHLRPARHRQQPAAGGGAVDHPAGRDHRCTCWRCAAPARWRTSDALDRGAASGSGMDGAGSGIPLRPTAFGGDQRLQRLADVRVPTHRLHASVVGRRGQQPRHVEVAGQFGGGRPWCDGHRACARHDGRVRGAALSRSSAATL